MKHTHSWATLLAVALGALVAAPTAAIAVTEAPGLPSAYGPTTPLVSHGGWAQRDPVVHLIFWGPSWTPTSPVVVAEVALFRELAGTQYNSLLGQYGVHNDVRLAGVWFDRSAPPSARRLTRDGLLAEALRARHSAHWRPSRNAQWVILPQAGTNFRAFSNECGEHDLRWSGGKPYVLDFIPPFDDPSFNSNCIYDYSSNNGTVPATSLVGATTSLTTHEYAEAATDPTAGTGWANGPVGSPVEIADLCYYYSGTPIGLTVNVSGLWDNSLQSSLDGCAL